MDMRWSPTLVCQDQLLIHHLQSLLVGQSPHLIRQETIVMPHTVAKVDDV